MSTNLLSLTKETANTELVKTANTGMEIDAELAALLDAGSRDNVDARAELRYSRLAIMQANSPELQQAKDGYKAGQLVDSINREIISSYGKAPWLLEQGVPANELKDQHYLPFIIIHKLPTEFIKWIPRKDRQEGQPPFEFKELDPNLPQVRAGVWSKRGGTFGKNGEKGAPPVTDNINYMIVPLKFVNEGTAEAPIVKVRPLAPIIATFSRTSADAGVTLTTAMDRLKPMRGIYPHQAVFYIYMTSEAYVTNSGTNYIQVMNIAESKMRADQACPEGAIMALETRKAFLHPKTGRETQLAVLNLTDTSDDHGGDTDVVGKSSNKSGSSNPVPPNGEFSSGEDPFPGQEF